MRRRILWSRLVSDFTIRNPYRKHLPREDLILLVVGSKGVLVEQHQFRVIRAGFREVGKIPSNRSDQAGLSLHPFVIGHRAMRIADSECVRIPQVRSMRTKSNHAPDHHRVDVGRSEASDLRSACIADSSHHTASPKMILPREPRFRENIERCNSTTTKPLFRRVTRVTTLQRHTKT